MTDTIFYVYSDGSTMLDKGVAVSCILTDNYFINKLITKYTTPIISTELEYLSVVQALKYLDLSKFRIDGVICYTDCKILLRYKKRFQESISFSMEKVTLKHLPAHKQKFNMNSLCDMLAYLHLIDLQVGQYFSKRVKCGTVTSAQS